MALKKINFDRFILLLSDDVRDVFKYYNVTEMHGLTHEGATKRINEGGTYCDGWANVAPFKGMKPFVFLNTKTMVELPLHETALLVMHETTHLAFLLIELDGGQAIWETENPGVDYEETIITNAEETAREIMKKLKFPAIHFNVNK
jgi:hypothetical protein